MDRYWCEIVDLVEDHGVPESCNGDSKLAIGIAEKYSEQGLILWIHKQEVKNDGVGIVAEIK